MWRGARRLGLYYSRRGEARLTLDNPHRFRVAWDEAAFPTTANNCSYSTASARATHSTCAVHDDTCVCDTDVVLTAALDAPPTTAAER